MSRNPTPELIRFLVIKFPGSTHRLRELPSLLAGSNDGHFAGFDRQAIETDAALAASDSRVADLPIRDAAKPVVLCFFEDGMNGKSSTCYLLKRQGLPVFATDGFFTELKTGWHGDPSLAELSRRFTPNRINVLVGELEKSGPRHRQVAELLTDPVHGFNPTQPLSILDGYVRGLAPAIVEKLRSNGARVWVARRAKG